MLITLLTCCDRQLDPPSLVRLGVVGLLALALGGPACSAPVTPEDSP